MKRLCRFLGISAAVGLALVGLSASFVFVATEPLIQRTYVMSLRPIAVPADEASIAEGRRLALVRGCFNGCHGPGVAGAEFEDDPWLGRMVAPELTQVVAAHSDEELERVIRQGVRRNGLSTWVMPSNMFYHLSDQDLGHIIAFLRSLPPGAGPATEVRIGPGWRLDLLQGRYLPMVEEIRRDAPWLTTPQMQGPDARGRYLALTVCTECHSMDLAGAPDGSAPNLVVVASYMEPDFMRLMRTGVPIGERDLGLMGLVARERFSQLNDDEVHDLYQYLSARARERP
ncbi:MAG: c-type cytochrome [Steroidobacteraceae bacterium]